MSLWEKHVVWWMKKMTLLKIKVSVLLLDWEMRLKDLHFGRFALVAGFGGGSGELRSL
jgi:hypothetical protein